MRTDEYPQRLFSRVEVEPQTERGYTSTVSVVISCYNYARYLPSAVASCLSQQDVTVDVIIVDDASTDDSLAVATSLSEKHPNVSVIAHRMNTGPVEAFNDGARVATGEFLVRLDADDLLTPGSLSRATLVAQSFPRVGLVYGHPLHFSKLPLPVPRESPTSWTIWPGHEWLSNVCTSGKNVITSPEVLMRRSLVADLGYLAPLAHSHDMELWLRLSAFADVAYIRGADQAWHREHHESLSAKNVDEFLDFRERVAAFDALFTGPASEVPAVTRLQQQARRTLAWEALGNARHAFARRPKEKAACEAWLELAESLVPAVTTDPQWGRLQQRLCLPSIPGSSQISSFALRLRRRIRSELQWHRWHRRGVY